MTKEEIIKYWIKSSDEDFKTMQFLFEKKRYHWSLFIGHLVIEKLLKAYYIKIVNEKYPFIHNLLKLATKSKLKLNDEQKYFFDIVTTFNINARYDDYKFDFYKKCTKKFTETWYNKIIEYRKWIKKELLKS